MKWAIRLSWKGRQSDNARALGSRRILTQNRNPLLLNAFLVAEFYARDEA